MKPIFEYDLHLPAGMESGRTYPAIFTLHGKGSNERNMHVLTESLTKDFIIIAIRGGLTLGAGFQYYELKSLGHPIRESFDLAVRSLQEFIAYATERYPIDAQRRYVLGFSQGAILAMTLALTMGEQLKGIVALNGYVPDFVKTEYPLQPVERVSVFVSHGEFDGVFPVRIGYETAAYWRELNAGLTFTIYPSEHTVTDENRRDFTEWLLRDAGLGLLHTKGGDIQ
ncbi:alpha/beta hydrolase [Paenibacillus chartarius]|uniref:Alpha/beta hydrolase n=1 Tax=Paenibacillus chartarius TaxID=747481 RepID=A0ABV6DFH4_9BACL